MCLFLQVSGTQISLLFKEYQVFFRWDIHWEKREADHSTPYTGQVSNNYTKAFMACTGAICLNSFVGSCVDGNVATVTGQKETMVNTNRLHNLMTSQYKMVVDIRFGFCCFARNANAFFKIRINFEGTFRELPHYIELL